MPASAFDTRVLVLDGETRSALAAVRSLGEAGFEVAVASHQQRAIAASSSAVDCSFRCPDPARSPDMYLKWLFLTVEDWQPNIVLPVTDISVSLALRNEDALRARTLLPTVSESQLAAVNDKGHLLYTAEQLGLRVPKTYQLPVLERWTAGDETAIRQMAYPAVLKPRLAICDFGSRFAKAELFYVESQEEVREALELSRSQIGRTIPYLLQECIEGTGIGVFSLCKDGHSLCEFCHQRLLEKPPSGGRSVLSMSIPPNEAPVEDALKLLEHLKWQGVAMVEFKRAADGKHYLMEINPRLWGSVQLAIDSKRDFPRLLCQLALQSIDAEELRQPYLHGQRLRWLLGTLDHALIRLKEERHIALREIFLRNALQIWADRKRTRLEVLRFSDLRPFFAELGAYCAALFGR